MPERRVVLLLIFWCHQQESNPHRSLRTGLLYPLSYGGRYRAAAGDERNVSYNEYMAEDNETQIEELKQLVRRSIALSEDTNKVVHSMRRSARPGQLAALGMVAAYSRGVGSDVLLLCAAVRRSHRARLYPGAGGGAAGAGLADADEPILPEYFLAQIIACFGRGFKKGLFLLESLYCFKEAAYRLGSSVGRASP